MTETSSRKIYSIKGLRNLFSAISRHLASNYLKKGKSFTRHASRRKYTFKMAGTATSLIAIISPNTLFLPFTGLLEITLSGLDWRLKWKILAGG